ncbi:MAG: protein kinase, partial [Pseudomonadota bacterium]|nr:protein kinase [Pseudomonadota bacterium]
MRDHTTKSSDYQVGEELVRQGEDILYRAVRREDRRSVLLKTYAAPDGSDQASDRLTREHRLLQSLPRDLVLPVLGIELVKGRTALVFDDPGGYFLASRLGANAIDLPAFLESALGMAETLAEIHRAGVVHRSIQPASIYTDPLTRKVRLAGFGSATDLPRTSQRVAPATIGDLSLAYLAPEQTGRMNRAVDRRTDLYSLGVVFYRLITGRLPFESDDA